MSSSTKPPLPLDSSQPSPPAGESPPEYSSPPSLIPSPPPAQVPPMASPPPYLSPPPPKPIVSPPPSVTPPPPAFSPPLLPPPSSPTPESPPPPVNPPPPFFYSSPPPPTSNYHPPPPPQSLNSPPPPTTNSPTPPPSSSPPPVVESLVSKPPPLSPPPPNNSPPPPLPPSRSSQLPPQAPLILKSPPPHSSPSAPSHSSTNSSSNHAPKVSDYSTFGNFGTGPTISVIVGIFVILGIFSYCCARTRKKASGRNSAHIMPTSSQESDPAFLKFQMSKSKNRSGSSSGLDIICSPSEHGGFGNSRSWFNYDELAEATNGFSAQNLLGEGGFGSVYKGRLANGTDVAVKQLKIGGGQGDREFRSEVEIISRIHHRHLVSLVGYCIIENRRLLVYEYVPNNNLYFHLHGEGMPVLSWALRVKIALGAARGIAYLHEDCHPRIIHRDIKSSNILIDCNFDARVSDFGLAKLALDANSHVTTRVMGTIGYVAPEYASSGKLTERSDVYSFGVVLLELITGRKPVDKSRPLGAESLVESARPLLTRALETEDFERLVDPRLEGQYVVSEMFRMIEAAAACVRHSFVKRPKMGQVVRALDTMASTDLTNGMRVGESEMFSPSTQSAEIRLFQRMAFGSPDEMSTGFFDNLDH